jgi:hypothetical protein
MNSIVARARNLRASSSRNGARRAASIAIAALALGVSFVFPSFAAAATHFVTNTNDAASNADPAYAGSLRAAIAASVDGDVVEFDTTVFGGPLPKTVLLAHGAINIAKDLTIIGPGHVSGGPGTLVTIDGAGSVRILQISSHAAVTITDLTFRNGRATSGGAVSIASGSTVTFLGCDFVSNTATASDGGGAIFNLGTLRLDDCLVATNSAPAGGGIATTGQLVITRSLVDGNIATGLGGGVYANGANVSIESSTFSGNRGGTGGGMAFVASSGPKRNASLTAVTFANNLSDANSGGLFVSGSSATATAGGSIFAGNLVLNGGGVQRDLGTQQSGKIGSADYNIVLKTGTTLSPSGANDQMNVDPLLGPLAYNGGRTRTHAISPGSPAIDRGNPAFTGTLVTTDQRGFGRASNGRADVGAFEFLGPTLTLASQFQFECQGITTSGPLTASLIMPTGGSVTVTWSVNGVPATPTVLNLPASELPAELTHTGLFNHGANTASVSISSGSLVLTRNTVVNVVDTTPPVITLVGPSVMIVECGTPFIDPGATATDICDPSVAITVNTGGLNTNALGVYSVVYTATDDSGNTATTTRMVTVVDTTAPTLAPVSPSVVYFNATNAATCASNSISSLGLTLSVSDAGDPSPTIIFELAAGGGSFSVITFPRTFPIGTTTVYVSARDASGNRSARQTVSVVVTDVAPPTVTLNGSATVSLQLGQAFVDLGVTATDCSSPVNVIRTVNGNPDGDVDSCAPGSYAIVYTAYDAVGNSASVSRTVNVTANISLSAPATVNRTVTTAFCTTPVDLAAIVTVTGLPAGCADSVYFVTTINPPTGPAIALDGLPTFNFEKGTSRVHVDVLFQPASGPAMILGSTEFDVAITDPYGVCLPNVAWPLAIPLELTPVTPSGKTASGFFRQVLAQAGESRWYKFHGAPGSRISIELANLPANFDIVVYSDIGEAYAELLGLIGPGSSEADKLLAILGAQFAPEAYAPEAYSPEAYAPEAYAPEAYAPEAYAPEAYAPEAYAPEAYAPEAYAPEAYAPEAYAPEAYAPEAYAPEAYAPEAYASAQQRSLIGFSASPGTVSEGIRFNTYTKTGEFYIRVRGQNGVYSPSVPFDVNVTVQQDLCSGVNDTATTPVSTPSATGSPTSLVVWDSARIAGTSDEKLALASSIAAFATAANAAVVDVSLDARITALNAQADANPFCPFAKNLVGEAIANLIQSYRATYPTIADVTLIGPDKAIPFFRTNDEAMLASEANYFPPVFDPTHSQSALRTAQVLTQDRYGSHCEVALGTGSYFLPDAPVGRVVESAVEVTAYLDTYRPLFNSANGVLPTPTSGLSVGYDFLADAAEAVRDEFTAGLGAGATVDELISPIDVPPVFGWTATQLRSALLGSRHDVIFLAGHFSTSGALAADYTTRFTAEELNDSTTDFTYSFILSPGCHSGFSTVDGDAIPIVTEQPDWAQAFSRKGAVLISGTGYQYGDTDFIEYTERLQLEIVRSLRSGTGPVSIGRAMVEAKNRYLAETPVMRGIHEKSLLQVVLYGLPMIKMNLPGARLPTVTVAGSVTSTTPATGPGAAHSLAVGTLAVTPNLTRVDRTLDVVGTDITIVASYYVGKDGSVSMPGEPLRPLETFNVSRPAAGLTRGVGFRSGQYVDATGFVPFTGAATTETRGVHGQFETEVWYPVLTWTLNQISELCDADGFSALNTFATQFLSDGPDQNTGTLRRYTQMSYSVFYCPEISEGALANPPAINIVSSSVDASGAHFSAEVAATEAAGVQEVWVTYTGMPGSPFHGMWQSMTLTAPGTASGIGTWTGTLPLPSGSDPASVRYFVQAVNGVGAVAASTNFGRYFKLGESTLDGIGIIGDPTNVTFIGTVPAGGAYRAIVPLQARLTDTNGNPMAGARILFRLGPAVKAGQTDANGIASVNLLLNARPDSYQLEAAYGGDLTHQSSSARSPFTVSKRPTQMMFTSGAIVANPYDVEILLRADDGTPLKERTVIFLLTSGGTTTPLAEITDGAGRARLSRVATYGSTYDISAYFGQPVTLPGGTVVTLDDPLYGPSAISKTVTVATGLKFSDDSAWLGYSDQTAPGASAGNRGISSVEVFGAVVGDTPGFTSSSILATPKAKTVTGQFRIELSGRIIGEGTLILDTKSGGVLHWRGSAIINGVTVKLNVDWDNGGKSGTYHFWSDIPAGNGPLWGDAPAIFALELILGTGNNETPAGWRTIIGGPDTPWTSENTNSRTRID